MTLTAEAYALELEAEYRRRQTAPSGPQADMIYQSNPIGWMVERMSIPEETLRWSRSPEYASHRWDGTPDPLVAVLDGLVANRDVGVESATGTGKTYLGALVTLWFLAVFPDSIVIITAPIEKQLTLHIWKEIGGLFPRYSKLFGDAELLTLKLRMRPNTDEKEKWSAVGFACGVDAGSDSATRAQGFHAQHMLIITEETPGIDPAVMTAFENTCTADHNLRLAFGNPDSQQDALHKFCTSPGVDHIRISAYDHPNVVTGRVIVPGAVSRKSITKRREKLGRESRLYQSRVRGISPTESVDALIRMSWCTAAKARAIPFQNDTRRTPALGVDVANSENGDLGAICRGSGRTCEVVDAFPCPDANQLGARVVQEAKLIGIDARHIGIDGVGVGAGTVNEAKRLDYYVQSLNGGDKAMENADAEKFYNLRAQMQWQARLDLERGEVALPDDDELIEDLIAPTWTTRNGKIIVESKEDLKRRLGRSPNKGDAFVYWNWVRDRDIPLVAAQLWDEGDHESLVWAEQSGDEMEPWKRTDDDYHQVLND